MESIILIWDYKYLYTRLSTLNEFKKILLLENRRQDIFDRVAAGFFDEIVFIESFHDEDEMLRLVLEINKRTPVRAILAPLERTVEVAGWLRTQLGIFGICEEISKCTRNKYLMKERAKHHHVPVARYALASSRDELHEKLNEIGFPSVIKPIAGSGSRGVHVISKPADIPLDLPDKVLVESLLHGAEYHCDSVVNRSGNIIFSSVGQYLHNCIDTINSDLPVGTIVLPPDHSAVVGEILALNERVVRAFDIHSTVTHIEFIVAADDIYFCEVAVRIGGGPLIGQCIQEVYGVSIYDAFVDVQVYGTYDFRTSAQMSMYSGSVGFPIKKGKIKNISTEASYSKTPGLVKIKIDNRVGDILDFQKDSTAERTGYSIINSNSFEDLAATLSQVYRNFVLEVE